MLAIADQKAKPNWLKAHWYPQGNIFSEFRIYFPKVYSTANKRSGKGTYFSLM